MLLNRTDSVLVLVDYQARLMPAIHEGQRALDEALFLGRIARLLEVPVVGTEHMPDKLGHNEAALGALCDLTLVKHHFGAVPAGLLEGVRRLNPGASQLVMAGCESHVCLMQTALGALSAGMQLHVVPSACGSRRPDDHALAMARLQQAGVVLTSAESVAFEWLEDGHHPRFRDALALIRPRADV